jgi:hypothetical protein
MRSRLVLLAVCCLLATAQATDSLSVEAPMPPRLGAYAAEFGAGLGTFVLGEGVGGGAGYAGKFVLAVGLVVSINGSPVYGVPIMAAGMGLAMVGSGMVVGAPGACGLMIAKVGDGGHEGGSKWAAVGGAYAGVVPGVGIAYAGHRLADGRHNGWLGLPFYVLGVFCVPAGATVGYNLSVHRKQLSSSLEMRLESPGLTFISAELPDHSVEYGVKVQLAGLRF